MQSTQELYSSLFAGNRVTLRVADRRAYESLRVALHKLHQTPRFLLEVTDLALCASFDAAQGLAAFWLGAPRKAQSRAPMQIVSIETVEGSDSESV